ncbi:MAG: hypothetical protein AAFP08_07950 [Bacteroidota bacterium]
MKVVYIFRLAQVDGLNRIGLRISCCDTDYWIDRFAIHPGGNGLRPAEVQKYQTFS